MAYIGFDMDECLGHVWPIDELVGFFTEGYTNDGKNEIRPVLENFSEEFRRALERGYFLFVSRLASAERLNLGLLRPGIVELFREIKHLKESGAVKATIIYSNNGRHALLKAVGDILGYLVGGDPQPFCAYIHYYHPYRKKIFYTEAKKFAILKQVFEEQCGGTVIPDKTLFIDDIIHPQIYNVLNTFGGYFHCKPYMYEVPQSVLYDIFKESVLDIGLAEMNEFFLYCETLHGIKAVSLNDFVEKYKAKYTSPKRRPSYTVRETGDRGLLRDWFDTQIMRIEKLSGLEMEGGAKKRVRRGKGIRGTRKAS